MAKGRCSSGGRQAEKREKRVERKSNNGTIKRGGVRLTECAKNKAAYSMVAQILPSILMVGGFCIVWPHEGLVVTDNECSPCT